MQAPNAHFLPAASLSHGHSPFNAQYDSYATASSIDDYHQLWLAGRRASGCCRTVSSTTLSALLQSAADAHSGGSEQGWLIEEDTTCTATLPDTWKSLAGLCPPTRSGIAETSAEMAPFNNPAHQWTKFMLR
ncbi:hypothetical protein HBI56_192280 [Parastagonospora nodorum]|nr:hypothetical protein HBH56_178050 [Parastagonospora nodorum]QRD06124.1 hypothetical protein JI435_146940 [Parastagonospora nodorum SN15]KAH3931753.1 hypothetical protein HBH54_091760 [Parastagonospora nodorum]KAH3939612.1 hypothetical protein HBH53_232660 [Parastagonospora nodorum]KAH3957452.1 hypothetical protein HBH51_224610 [Parastagonospora nodorum]